MNLVRREAPYEPPARPRYQAFQGTGRTLSSAPPAVSVKFKASGNHTSLQRVRCQASQGIGRTLACAPPALFVDT